ncbi:NmrA/HSCARG family protein [Streptomyces sp. NPDC047028]|uniref:NmrA/HSCARG family protein n=1 Tax=Streptomyces sp. NPDC047028 TaxID=3155793 RepID=UPI0033CFBA9F
MSVIAVAGATGAQGGATARALLAAGHRVRALTRSPTSSAATALRDLGAEVHRADFEDRTSLAAALTGADALFAVTTPFEADTSAEVRQGGYLVDEAVSAGVGHIVFTSAAHADRRTGIPHYDSKFAIERHLRASGVPWTVIAPAAFMDNWSSHWTLEGLREDVFGWPMPPGTPLALIPAEDIGAFAALALTRPGEFTGRRIDIASDALTPEQIAQILARATGRSVTHRRTPLAAVRAHSSDLAAMFAYFTSPGLDVDTAALRRAHPEVGWHSFADWAAAQDWRTLLA